MKKVLVFLSVNLGLAAFHAKAQGEEKSQERLAVTGTRSQHSVWESPVPSQTILIDELALQHYSTVAAILANAPGFDLVRGIRGQSVRLDGLDPKYTLVLVDGQRMTGKINDAYDLDSIELEGIQRIEIIRGAGSALYGSDAIAGVVNLITREGGKNVVRVHVDSNSQRDASASTGLKAESTSMNLDIFTHRSDPLNVPGSEATRFIGSHKIGAQLEPRWSGRTWDVKGRVHSSREVLEGTEIGTAGAILKRKNDLAATAISLEPSAHFADDSQLQTSVKHEESRDDYHQSLRRTGMDLTHEKTVERVVETNVSYSRPIEAQVLSIGAQNINESMDSDRILEGKAKRQRAAVYLQDEYAFGDGQYSIVPAIRQDHDTQYKNHFTKKLSLRYLPDSHQSYSLSYGEGYRAPSFKELYLLFENTSVGYVVEGNDRLKPESSRSVHGQYSYRTDGVWTLRASAYHNAIKDLIENRLLVQDVSGTIHYTYMNTAAAETSGSDVNLTGDFSNSWSLGANYSFLQARDLTTQTALAGRSKHTLSSQIRYSIGELSLANQLKWQSSRQGGSDWFSNKKAIITGDLVLSYRHDRSWLYSIALENIGGSAGDMYWNIPPRSIGASISWIPHNS
ncbi:MAG: TonB-dependent receptor [Chitinophagaceae bacterium]|nr:TonB-dependent receptor [Oligoflexus sp.]